jgi:hypothetical protein
MLRKTLRGEIPITSMALDLHGAHDGCKAQRKKSRKVEMGGKDKYCAASNFSQHHKNSI